MPVVWHRQLILEGPTQPFVGSHNQVNLTTLVVDEVSLVGSRCGPFAPALRLLEQGLVDVESLIDAVYPLSDGIAAFEHAATKGALKVLVKIA